MRVLYLDCASGISGDMFIGAMLDAGLDFSFLEKELSKLKLKGYRVRKRTVRRNSIRGTKFDVLIHNAEKGHRSLKAITAIIDKSRLDPDVKGLSKKIFFNIAKAESRAHNTSFEKVHFHEVGDLDSIIDIVGAAIAVKKMGIDKVYGSSLNLGRNGPATLNLLEGVKATFSGIPYELVTPTGAGIFKTLVEESNLPSPMTVSRTGFGAGSNEIEGLPNLLRAVIGQTDDSMYDEDKVMVIQANIDDMKPVMYDYVMERLFDAGALDVFLTHTYGKKSRLGALLTVLAREPLLRKLANIIFEETTTIGLRYYETRRLVLKRRTKKVKTKYGTINFKISRINDSSYRLSPEYEDCKRVARKARLPLQRIYEEAEKKVAK